VNPVLRPGGVRTTVSACTAVLVLDSRAVRSDGTLVLLAAFVGQLTIWARAKADLDELFAVRENPEGSSL
jgi:hypothetical protein